MIVSSDSPTYIFHDQEFENVHNLTCLMYIYMPGIEILKTNSSISRPRFLNVKTVRGSTVIMM